MTKKKKWFLLISLSFFCLLVIVPIILYSLGWRIDLKERKIIQVGSFYFRIWPRGAEISLIPFHKDELAKKNTIRKKTLFNFIYIENMLPKKYLTIIEKEGFYSWEKILELEPGMVTESKNITLVKKNPYFNLISEEVNNFYISPDEKKIIFLDKNAINLFDLTTNKKIILAKIPFDFKDLKFFFDSKNILLETEKGYSILDAKTLSISPLPIKGKIVFNPKNTENIHFIKDNFLYNKNLITNKEEKISENIISALILENEIFYLDKEGFLVKHNLFREKINQIPLEIKNLNYEILFIDSIFYIKEGDKIYSFNQIEKKFDYFLESVLKKAESYNKEKIFFSNKNELRILFLKKQYDHPQREKGEMIFLSRFSEEIKDIFWWTNHYLIFLLDNKIKIMEIDNRDKINIFQLSDMEVSKLFWSRINRKIIFLSEKQLYISESLIF